MNIDFTKNILMKREQDTLDRPFPTGDGFAIYTKNYKEEIVRLSFSTREETEAFMAEKGYDWGPEKDRLTDFANEKILLQIYPELENAKQVSAADPQWNIPEGEIKLDYDGTSKRNVKDCPCVTELREVDHVPSATASSKKDDKKDDKKDKKNDKDDKNGEKDDDSKESKDGKKLPPWLNKKKSKGRDYSKLYKKVKAEEAFAPCGPKGCFYSPGDHVKNVNPECKHYESEGIVKKVNKIPGDKGETVAYQCTNAGKTWKEGDTLEKTKDQLAKGNCRSGKCIY